MAALDGTDIAGTNATTYDPPSNLTSSRWYRREAVSCGETKYTGSVKVTVNPTLSVGSISGAQTICYNGDPSTLTSTAAASGGNGSITYTWQYSNNGSSGWTDISSTNATTYNPPANLTSSRWYRRKAVSCGETKYTSSVKVTVNPTLSVGSISGAQTVCFNGNPSALTSTAAASGGNGSITYTWQYSTNGTSNWIDISGTNSTTYDPGALTNSRWYRREAVSCGETKYTSSVKVTVNPTLSVGSIAGAQTICYDGNPGTLTSTAAASGGNGSITYTWQYSSNGSSGWTDIAGTNATTYDPPSNLTSSRWYRREAVSCGETKYTGSVKVTVNPTLSVGSITGAQTICYNGNPSVLGNGGSASGGNGSITYTWQYSSNGSSGWTDIAGTNATTYDPPANLTSSRWYRRKAVSCGETKYTGSVKVTVNPTLSVGGISGTQTVCYNGNPSVLTNTTPPSGGNGSYTYQWQVSTNNSSWSNISGATSSTYDPSTLTSDRWYRRQVTSCGETKQSASVKVTVNPTLVAGSIGNAQTVCYNGDPTTLTNTALPSAGNGSYTYQWQVSTDNSSWSNISGATSTTYNPGNLTSDRWYRRAAISCGENQIY